MPRIKLPMLTIIIKATVISLLLLSGYYLLVLQPRYAAFRSLTQTETTIAALHTNLLQNRLAFIELTQLDATSLSFDDEKGALLDTLNITREEGAKLSSAPTSIPKVHGLGDSSIFFVNSELPDTLNRLKQSHYDILKAQQSTFEVVAAIDSTLHNIFKYSPASDLGNLDPTTQSEVITTRAKNAISGLSGISQKLQSIKTNLPEINQLQSQLSTTQATLGALTSDNLSDTYSDFANLKQTALNAQLAPIRSPESISFLTSQTNLLNDYEKLLDKLLEIKANTNNKE